METTKRKVKYYFTVCLFGKYESTPRRDTEKEAWSDVYKLASGKDAKYITMTLIQESSYYKEEGAQ